MLLGISLGKECFVSQLCFLEQWSTGQAEKCSQHHSGQDMCNAIIDNFAWPIPTGEIQPIEVMK